MFRLTSGFFICWIDNVCFAEHPTQRLGQNYFIGSFENEALENEDRSTKHPNLENEAP